MVGIYSNLSKLKLGYLAWINGATSTLVIKQYSMTINRNITSSTPYIQSKSDSVNTTGGYSYAIFLKYFDATKYANELNFNIYVTFNDALQTIS